MNYMTSKRESSISTYQWPEPILRVSKMEVDMFDVGVLLERVEYFIHKRV